MENQKKFNIGVFFGSKSPEHDISIITGQLIMSGLKGLGYPVIPVYLSKKGEWLLGEELGFLKTFTDPQKKISVKKLGRYYLDLENSVGKLVFKKKGLGGRAVQVDLAFPAFHGSFGEDGTIQGLFEIFGLPYVGCDVTSSALTMDKILTKQFYQGQGIATTNFMFYDRPAWLTRKSEILDEVQRKLQWPVFVKPARLGSSIGVAKAKTMKDLEFAIEVALQYDERFLVEESVEDLMDVTVAVLGNENPRASLLQESVFTDELFSYEEKYLKEGGTQLGKAVSNIVIPARLDAVTTQEIQNAGIKIFQLFGCSGIARVDFLYDKRAEKFYANEVNTLPGTLYHHLWEKSGVNLGELLQELLRLAWERHLAKKKSISTFNSELLRRLHGTKLRTKGSKFNGNV